MKTRLSAATLAAALALAASPALAQKERTGEEIVKQQCAACHAEGKDGAPRIDQRGEWVPRMKKGVEATVRTAIRGHGKMPARGGMADLSDTELRAAILYMFYPAASLRPATPPSAPAAQDPGVRVLSGMDIHLGVMLAEAVRAAGKPSGKDQYHVNVTLRDSATKAPVQGARVEARVSNPVAGAQSRRLDALGADAPGSYGAFFRMGSREPYTIRVRIHKAQGSPPVEARFDFKR